MLATFDSERFRRALSVVIAVVLASGAMAAAVGGSSPATPERAALPDEPTGTTTTTVETAVVETADPTSAPPTAPEPPAPLGPAAVPATGVYHYAVDEVRDGEASSRSEEREFTIVGEEGASSIVQVVARSDGERQVSVLAWSPDEVVVRSTRIESEDGPAEDCTWQPAFTEFAALAVGATWTVDSTCTTDVAGLATEFVVRGTSRVVGEVEVVHAGAPVRVWQVARDRTTTISATIGSDAVEQVVREVGTLFVDPARGLTLRSDVTVTLSGVQEGETRRTSVLIEP